MEDGSPVPLHGIVEIDETWIGGKQKLFKGTPCSNKTTVLGAVERGGDLRLEVRKGPGRESKVSYRSFVKNAADDKAEFIFTDSNYAWGEMTTWDRKHRKVDHGGEECVRGIVHTNTIESVSSLFKRSVIGTYHQLSATDLPAYLDEMAFRFNNRDNAFLFRDTLLRMVEGEMLPYAELVSPS
jgi:hypothetical protein